MIDINLAQIFIIFIPFFRITSFLLTCPILGSTHIPKKVKIILALIITIILTPQFLNIYQNEFNIIKLISLIMQEIIIGLILGFSVQMFMAIFNIAGQLAATQMGLGFAASLDPNNGASSALIGQLFTICATLVFLKLDLHLLLLEIISSSFISIPNLNSLYWQILIKLSWILSSGLLLSLPIITILIMLNLLFGVISKAASNLNIFALGFSLTLIIGLLVLYLTFNSFITGYYKIANEILSFLNSLIK